MLDAAEIGRLRATQITFNSAGNVTFNAATINAATALNGASGGFRVATPGVDPHRRQCRLHQHDGDQHGDLRRGPAVRDRDPDRAAAPAGGPIMR
ncbi:MAG: hypothetical protein PGN08_00220 [Sphingomonas taxi]